MIMSSVKSKSVNVKDQTNNNRRSFLWKAGAALSAGLAAAVPGMAKTNETERADRLARQVTRLEDENAIRRLHSTFERYLDSGRYSEIAELFTNDAEVFFNGGIFKGKDSGIKRLYGEHFSAGKTGRKMPPAPGLQVAEQQQEAIELSQDGKSARTRLPYSIQAGAPLPDDSVLVQMARLHGEGIRHWWEGGIYEFNLAKDEHDGSWKIARLEHRVLARADYKPGRSQSNPVAVAPFDKVYPEEPTGPDELITRA
jgi:hypothetical protein